MSGVMSVHNMRASGLEVGLGTDVSGGYSPSILDSVRQAIIASKVRRIADAAQPPLSHREGLYLATLGGGRALGLQDVIGSFHVGKDFDALVIDPAAPGGSAPAASAPPCTCPVPSFRAYARPGSAMAPFEQDTQDDILSKFIYLGSADPDGGLCSRRGTALTIACPVGDDRNIVQVFVAGVDVSPRLKAHQPQ
jgi:hypothetical protein